MYMILKDFISIFYNSDAEKVKRMDLKHLRQVYRQTSIRI